MITGLASETKSERAARLRPEIATGGRAAAMPPEIRRRRIRPARPRREPLRHASFIAALALPLAACVSTDLATIAPRPEAAPAAEQAEEGVAPPAMAYASPGGTGEVDRLITHYAAVYEVPETLVRRVVKRESNFNPRAYNGGHYGLMQIKPATARTMGFRGEASGLFDAETNLAYAVKYLRGAWLVADGNHDRAVRFYASGYYYDAKRRGMLEETGLGKDRRRMRRR